MAGLKYMTSPMLGAARRYWASSPPRMCGGPAPGCGRPAERGVRVGLRERREREGERKQEVEEVGGGEKPLFIPTPYFMASVGEE